MGRVSLIALLPLALFWPRAAPPPGAGGVAVEASSVLGEAALLMDSALANDNRRSAGRVEAGVLEVRLEARLAGWRPDASVDSLVTVQAFGEEGGPAVIPGPLVRAVEGMTVRVRIHNAVPDSELVVTGLRPGSGESLDTVHVAAGSTRTITYRAGRPGTYLYWGTTSHQALADRAGRDSQLNGVIVIEGPGTRRAPGERIFVISLIDILPDTTRPPPREDIWEVAINGRSWPHTERLQHEVGDTVRWQFVNASGRVHPMHLHGFHFRVLGKGDGAHDTIYSPEQTRLAVTELMVPGSTFRLEWTPTRAGNWLVHCHMAAHVTPFPERPDSLRRHDSHDVARHPLEAMAGLVLGITVREPWAAAAAPVRPAGPAERLPARRLRLMAEERAVGDSGAVQRGFVLRRAGESQADSLAGVGPPLLLRRDETAAITVVNHLSQPTTVHWHGMELESVYDGVSGWSGNGTSMAPLLAPGDSFVVQFTPPRAGTYIYHTHMDEEAQLASGMYGPLLVLEPGETYQPATDLVFVIGSTVEKGPPGPAINGRHQPAPLQLAAGREYRLRFINILLNAPIKVELHGDSGLMRWRHISKDGAALPPAQQLDLAAGVRLGVGETYDFLWRPAKAGAYELRVSGGPREAVELRQVLSVL